MFRRHRPIFSGTDHRLLPRNAIRPARGLGKHGGTLERVPSMKFWNEGSNAFVCVSSGSNGAPSPRHSRAENSWFPTIRPLPLASPRARENVGADREGGLLGAGFWASRGRHPSLTSKGGLHATTAGGDQLGWQSVGGWLFLWPLPRRRLELVELSRDDGWHYAAMRGRKEVGRPAYAPGCDAGGDWFWAVRYGPHGYEPTRAKALAALAASYAAAPPRELSATG
jgi:hypothetical protein